MEVQTVSKFVLNNVLYLIGGLGVLVIVMYAIIIHLWMSLSYMKKQHKKIMTGATGDNLETMLVGHIEKVKAVEEDNARIDHENKRIDTLLQQAITRVGVVRFCAFENMGSDLSYAVALLDAHDNGVILSSLFGREDSRSYVKPIENGHSSYALTKEEEEALHKAIASASAD